MLKKNIYVFWGLPSVIFILLLVISSPVSAQITAQGQGGNDVIWTAFGIKQQLGKRWSSSTSLATSRHSSTDTWNMFEQTGVTTVRQGFSYRLGKAFSISQTFMYANSQYHDDSHPSSVNEFRLYPKITHNWKLGRVSMSQYLRWDIRFFSARGLVYDKPFEYRNRYRLKATIPLDQATSNEIIGMTEFFFATNKVISGEDQATFTPFIYRENRISVYYRHHFPKQHLILDIGVMNQLWRKSLSEPFHDSILFQMDVILINPISRLVHKD